MQSSGGCCESCLRAGSYLAQTRMIETLKLRYIASVSIKKSMILCFSILATSKGTAIDCAVDLLPIYLKISGQEFLKVTPVVTVCAT